jgi:hypothetical protein
MGILMPNKAAKRRKDERREKDAHLSKYGRTPAQIKRKKAQMQRKKHAPIW